MMSATTIIERIVIEAIKRMESMAVVYLNGEYVAKEEAKISVFDRGFLFADAIYEVTCVFGGELIDFERHAKRLDRSLEEMKIVPTLSREELLEMHRELISRNNLENGYVYVQFTRGTDVTRDFVHPDPEKVAPSIVGFTNVLPDFLTDPDAEKGIKVKSMPDLRWGRRDIKTVQLLYSSMAKSRALEAGADDAWLVQDGYVTEGTANNAFIVSGKKIITRELSTALLPGTMRAAVLEFANDNGYVVDERPFCIEEALNAEEAFISSSGHFVTPVVEIDGCKIGEGAPGPVARNLRALLLEGLQRV